MYASASVKRRRKTAAICLGGASAERLGTRPGEVVEHGDLHKPTTDKRHRDKDRVWVSFVCKKATKHV